MEGHEAPAEAVKDKISSASILSLGVCKAVNAVWSLDFNPSMIKELFRFNLSNYYENIPMAAED